MEANIAYLSGKVSESVYKNFGVFWSRDAFSIAAQSTLWFTNNSS